MIYFLLKFFLLFYFGSNKYEKKKKKASRVLEEFANVRTILPNFSSFLRFRIHSIELFENATGLRNFGPGITAQKRRLRNYLFRKTDN